MQDATGEIRRDGVNRDRGSSSSVRAEFGCSVRTHAATEGGIKINASPLEKKPILRTEGEVGPAGKHESQPLPRALGTCSQGNGSVCGIAAPARAVIASLQPSLQSGLLGMSASSMASFPKATISGRRDSLTIAGAPPCT